MESELVSSLMVVDKLLLLLPSMLELALLLTNGDDDSEAKG